VTLIALILAVAPPALLPVDAPQHPGQLRVEGPRAIPSANHEDPKNCGSCHADIAAQWRTSAHALASFNNPVYRVTVEKLRADRGVGASRMCAACHDLALLTSGGMDAKEIAPDDPRAHAGITCTSCHSAIHTARDGNGSLTLRSDTVFPTKNEDTSLEAHRARVAAKALRTADLCGGCHRAFLDATTGNEAAFFGMDDLSHWERSAFAGSTAERPDHVKQQDCKACHMAREPAVLGDVSAKNGTVPSHRFLGGHTYLAAMRGDADTLARVQKFLRDSVTVDVGAARVNGGAWAIPAERATPKAGDQLDLDVVIFNEKTGHRFPGGVLDNQGALVDLEVLAADGRVLAHSKDHELRAQIVDREGRPVQRRETHEFLTVVWNHTVPARDSRAVRFSVTLPATLQPKDLPLSVRARVTHVARLAEMADFACADAKTKRAQAFQAASLKLTGAKLDACVPQPTTIVAEATRRLDGQGADASFLRSYRLGLGRAVALQEYLDEAEQAFRDALARAKTTEERTTAAWALGSLAGHRGQTDAALAWLDRAEVDTGPTPATLKARGDAYAQVWRWQKAADQYRLAAERAPMDLTLWQSLAMAEASVGRYEQALAAAQKGLELHPRDGDCLRVQALSLEHLGADAQTISVSLDRALQYRTPDDGPKAKAMCSKLVPRCADRRNPVPNYAVEAAAP
jgi:predicted negative regulator of RcsB-dependent stress response